MKLRNRLENELRELSDVEVSTWKDTDLMCVFYRRKEIAHFHDHEEIDVRLSQKFIKKEGLSPIEHSPYHLKRSKKSRWMQLRFKTAQDSKYLVGLFKRLIKEEYENTEWGTKS